MTPEFKSLVTEEVRKVASAARLEALEEAASIAESLLDRVVTDPLLIPVGNANEAVQQTSEIIAAAIRERAKQ